jgi:integrase
MTRINGAGSIERLGKGKGRGTYRIRFNLGRNPITGKYGYSPWRTIRNVTKADAMTALSDYRKEIEGGLVLDADKVTFREFAERFINQREAIGSNSPSTVRYYRVCVTILNEHLGDVPLRDISVSVVQSLMAALGTAGKTPDTVRRAYTTLKRILQDAVMEDLLLRNPCDRVKAPKVSRPEISYLDQKGIARLLAALETTEAEGIRLMALPPVRKDAQQSGGQLQGISLLSRCMAVRLALATGGRRGEVLGPVWGCMDFEGQCIRIAQQLTADGIRTPKTERGKRIVALDADTLKRLGIWKRIQGEYLLSLGIAQDTNTPIITDELGGFHDPDNFSRWWRSFCVKYGFGEYRDDNGKPIPPPRYNEQGQQVDEKGRCYS